MRSAGVGRGLALAIAFLLVGVAGGDAGHALAGLEGHGFGSDLPETDAPCDPCDSAPPHDATNCLLCRAARVAEVILTTSAACTPAIAGECSAMSLPEALAPYAPRRRTETARAPPARLAV
jgi:hypothetical protein